MRQMRQPDRKPPELMDPNRRREGRRILSLFRPYRARLTIRAGDDRRLGRGQHAQPFLLRDAWTDGSSKHQGTLLD